MGKVASVLAGVGRKSKIVLTLLPRRGIRVEVSSLSSAEIEEFRTIFGCEPLVTRANTKRVREKLDRLFRAPKTFTGRAQASHLVRMFSRAKTLAEGAGFSVS